MIVTEVTEHGKNKYKVYVDYEFAFVLYKGELHKYRIKKGLEIEPQLFRELTQNVLPKRAKLRAMNLLAKRPYTEEQLRKKLKEGFYAEVDVESAIAYVKSFGYVNDEVYARDYILYHLENTGHRNIRQKLLQKGIDRQLVDSLIEQIDGEEIRHAQREQIRALFMKKYNGEMPSEPAQKTKVWNYFLRKGYSVSEVKEALDEKSLDDLYN